MANLTDLLASQRVKASAAKEVASPVVATTPITPRLNRKRPWIQPESDKLEKASRPPHGSESFEETPIISEPKITEHKVDTNRAQTEHVTEHKVDTNRAQTEHVRSSVRTIAYETEHKPDTKPDTQLDTKWTQTAHKLNTKFGFSSLIGLQKDLAILVYESCQKNRSRTSAAITLDFVSTTLKVKIGSVKTTFRRLEEKHILSRVEYKNGRGGWAKFELSNDAFSEILQLETEHKLSTNRAQSGYKPDTKLNTQPDTSSPIVVVSNLNSKNTTNTESSISDEPCFVIPQELSGKVSRRQLSEFVTLGKISESDLQLSLDAFAYDLRNNLVSIKFSNNPVGLLIGAIKNNGSYNSAKYVESAKAELRPFIESQREASAQKQELKASKEWEVFQTFKQENPDDYKNLEQKVLDLGFKGALLEEFTYLEYKKEVLKVGEELNLNPLRPMEHITS